MGGVAAVRTGNTFLLKDPPARFRLIGPDIRGNGASTGFEGTHSFRQSASDMFALLDHLGVRSVKAIGLSGGGIILLHMATQQPDPNRPDPNRPRPEKDPSRPFDRPRENTPGQKPGQPNPNNPRPNTVPRPDEEGSPDNEPSRRAPDKR